MALVLKLLRANFRDRDWQRGQGYQRTRRVTRCEVAQGDDGHAQIESEVHGSAANTYQQQVRVQTSRKGRGGKTVTVITGFQAKPETLADLLKQLKAQCGAGGAVKDNEIEIQGDHRDKLVQLLNQLGYKAKGSGG